MRRVLLSHGSGGEETQRLIKELFLKYLSNPILERMEDAAILEVGSKLAFTTDSFTVSPPFFKGGDIGKLAVAGTVNDLAVMGARPLYMSAGFIIEEGFSLEELEKVVKSMGEEARRAGVYIVTGDTKVVPKGQVDKLFINTSGIGEVVYEGLSAHNLQPGDVVIVSGTVGDHGACILAEREGMEFELPLESDCRSLWNMIERVLETGAQIHAMRDATRGGLAAVLNEWAQQSEVEIEVDEESIPVKEAVQGLCELLGFEPTHLANEGMVVFAVAEKDAGKVLETLREHPYGKEAELIGSVTGKEKARVVLKTPYGVKRIMEPPSGELLPRIC
ncbi:hydrogenase maturation carbamoyl dehydratase HypE [Hydrogenivirga caldilitoris]|uniref:Hydrogenase maturation carbamoyl dehydratase HypE n=1 Tax=Hydrogenivirga caldilitoris TaxID=246264 RepID=A0A497XTA6_9AQUI|nr:hydrogenase expression/formation protein HypE [Hydrogenivirga caldilitoris]RLJ70372.1 hydrogenase maturation carbamoyl dehydratase HypE [Hydrogenivirga caldilitoris]